MIPIKKIRKTKFINSFSQSCYLMSIVDNRAIAQGYQKNAALWKNATFFKK